jgi:MFS family permease
VRIVHYDSAAAEWRAYTPLVVTAMAGVALSATLTFTLGVMMPSIEAEFGWTRAQISTGPMLVSFAGLLLATAAGYVIDRIGARKVGIVVAITMSSVIALMSTMTDNLWHWWIIWGIFALAATATSTVWLAPISSVFVKSRGLALAVTLTGTGIASGLAPVFCYYFIENYDWRTGYLVLGLVLGAITIPLVLLFWRGAEEFGRQSEDGQGEETRGQAPAPETLPGMTVREGFTSANFYKLFAGYVISSVAGIAIILNLVPVLISTGISAGQAAAVAGAHGLSSIAGRFIGGGAMDRFGAKPMIIVATLGAAALPLGLLLSPGSVAVAVAAVTINAFMGGMKMPAIVYLISRYFGPRSFGTLFGTISISSSVGVGIGPLIANHIYDVTHSYTLVLWVATPAVLVAAALYALLGRYPDFSAPKPTDNEG